jgi:hypothetical protein
MDFREQYEEVARLLEESLARLRETRERFARLGLGGDDLNEPLGVRAPNHPRTPPRLDHVAVDLDD